MLKYSLPGSLQLKTSPNPVIQGSEFTLYVVADKEQEAAIHITDNNGRIHYLKKQLLNQGINKIAIIPPVTFSRGLYFVMLAG
jgi:hypothetical protein